MWSRIVVLLAVLLFAVACASEPAGVGDSVEAEQSGSSQATASPGSSDDEDADDTIAGSESLEGAPDPNEIELGSPTLLDPPTCDADVVFPSGRTDVRADGNRIADGSLDLRGEQRSVDLPGEAEWVVADPSVSGGWYVSLADGRAVRVDGAGAVSDAGAAPDGPPELTEAGEARSPWTNQSLFDDALADGRVVRSGDFAVALAGPTDRYGHGVLGDAIEASAIVFANLCTNERGRIEIDPPDVIEGVAPLLADVDGDSELEILVTLSNDSDGARLAVYEFSGTLLAESAPIGRPNRWRNQLAVGPIGPGGETEVIDVRTPHIGGTVQAFRLVFGDDPVRLERVAASDDRYTSHVIGSGNLDMGLAVDTNADGRLDVLVPRSDRETLVALTRTPDAQGWETVADVSLNGQLTSNLASQTVEGRTTLAAGVGDVLFLVG